MLEENCNGFLEINTVFYIAETPGVQVLYTYTLKLINESLNRVYLERLNRR